MTNTNELAVDELACPTCKTREDLVISGLDVAAILGRYASEDDNSRKWAVKCWGCKASYRIDDETRDVLFGTAWRNA